MTDRAARFTRCQPHHRKSLHRKPSLLLIRARYYDVTTGEFIARDPLEYVDGMSLMRGYFALVSSDPLGYNVYAVDGTWADESADAWPSIPLGYSNVHQFYVETTEDPSYYWGGPGTRGLSNTRLENGARGGDTYDIIKLVYTQICEDFCIAKTNCTCGNCPDIEINLVGWSRGAVAAVEVADWLNYYGCKCLMPGDWSRSRFKPVRVNFLGLFDPVEMVWAIGSRFENTIPPNVDFSYALWRTDLAGLIYPQKRYTNLSKEEDFWIHKIVKTSRHQYVSKRMSTHGDVGRDPQAFYRHMKPEAIAHGVDF